MILGIETSCDDTCAAIISREGEIRSNVISSQGIHVKYGGVVPEIASRQHLELIGAVVDDAFDRAELQWNDIDRIAVTCGPGLIGALLVGVASAKAFASTLELPLVGVDHLVGHIAGNFLAPNPFEPPFICLIASGGHTLLVRVDSHDRYVLLGQTLDDAAGEAFDKGARLLGLSYPGGPELERLATGGDPTAFTFPTAKRVGGCDFSFSGLKTALLYKTRELGATETSRRSADLAASYQEAIVEALIVRIQRGMQQTGIQRVAIGGGVAANKRLRERLSELDVEHYLPQMQLCTDNAAMIASAARFQTPLPFPKYLNLDVYPSGERLSWITSEEQAVGSVR